MQCAALADQIERLRGDVVAGIEPQGEHRRELDLNPASEVTAILRRTRSVRHRRSGRNKRIELPASGDERPNPRALRRRIHQKVIKTLVNRRAYLIGRPYNSELAAAVPIAELVADEALRVQRQPRRDTKAIHHFVLGDCVGKPQYVAFQYRIATTQR